VSDWWVFVLPSSNPAQTDQTIPLYCNTNAHNTTQSLFVPVIFFCDEFLTPEPVLLNDNTTPKRTKKMPTQGAMFYYDHLFFKNGVYIWDNINLPSAIGLHIIIQKQLMCGWQHRQPKRKISVLNLVFFLFAKPPLPQYLPWILPPLPIVITTERACKRTKLPNPLGSWFWTLFFVAFCVLWKQAT